MLIERCLGKGSPATKGRHVRRVLFVMSEPLWSADRFTALNPSDLAAGRRCGGRQVAAAVVMSAMLAGAGVWWLTRLAPASIVRTTIATSGKTRCAARHGSRSRDHA